MAKRYHRKFKHRPDHIYVGSINVSTKPISDKFSWTVHQEREKAITEANLSVIARKHGRHTRRLYRVNVFLKLSALRDRGLMVSYPNE